MEGTTGSRRQAEQRVISYGSPLPTRIMGQLSVNLGRSLELQMEAVIGYRSKVEQPSCSPGFPLSTQTTESPSAFLVSSSGQQTEEKIGCVRTVEQTMVFREFPAPMPIMERLWVTVAPFSEQWGRSRRHHPPRLLHQLQRLLRHRGPDRLHRLTRLHRPIRLRLDTRGRLS